FEWLSGNADGVELGLEGGCKLSWIQASMVKVSGRRASLAALNLLGAGIPELGDAVLFQPAAAGPTARLVLVHAGEPVERRRVESLLRDRIDSVFLPRAIIRVARLPRTTTGKLPLPALESVYRDWLAAEAQR